MKQHIPWLWAAGALGALGAIAGLSAQESCACRPARFWLGGAYMRSLVNAQLEHHHTSGVFSDVLNDSDVLNNTAQNGGLGNGGDSQRDGKAERDRVQDYYTLTFETTPTTAIMALTPRADATKIITYQLLGQRLWERTVPADDVYGYVASLTVNPTRHLTSNSSSNSLGSEPTVAEPAVVICKATQPGAIALPTPTLAEGHVTCSPGTRAE